MAGTLGVSTFAYFPFCFLNLINPLFSMLYAATGFQVKYIETPAAETDLQSSDATTPQPVTAAEVQPAASGLTEVLDSPYQTAPSESDDAERKAA
jgi:hypothetical protein